MLTKMSFEPAACARSRSWCTSWKSRVASAVETTVVGVIGSASTGSCSPTLSALIAVARSAG